MVIMMVMMAIMMVVVIMTSTPKCMNLITKEALIHL